jgi:hypothetical protein
VGDFGDNAHVDPAREDVVDECAHERSARCDTMSRHPVSASRVMLASVVNWFEADTWIPRARQETWEWTIHVGENAVDTELGDEEVYGQIALANATTSSQSIVSTSLIINVSPN